MSTTPVLTPHLAGATSAELEDWGPLEEATGPEMATAGATLWDEFYPARYHVAITLDSPHGTDECRLTSGLRSFRRTGTQFTITATPKSISKPPET